jgi:Co/Zn/Cd efflux system component
MHSHSVERWTHDHVFLGREHRGNERRTWWVVALTAAMMIGEVLGGSIFGSMALLADGWHMATHAAALGIAGLAYLFARQHDAILASPLAPVSSANWRHFPAPLFSR